MIEIIKYPAKESWEELCLRPLADIPEIKEKVAAIMQEVKEKGDAALYDFSEKFDGVRLKTISYQVPEIPTITEELIEAIQLAISNIECFHKSQVVQVRKVETAPGVTCWRKQVPIEKVGLYIPGGTAPLFSTLLMLAIPAKIAGCREIIVCTPPSRNGSVDPVIASVARLLEINRIFMVGGAQAIAAMAYGTESVPKVDKIFGPGNNYVTLAKQMAQQNGVAIDMPAGPSEVLVIADSTSNPAYVAADLLSQAEHGADSQVILLSDSQTVIEATLKDFSLQLNSIPRKGIAAQALKNSKAILVENILQAIEFSNLYAPEHLILAIENHEDISDLVSNAGSVFLGIYGCESAGDYASGTNHTLPTNGFAKSYSGVSVDSFTKNITFQKISPQGLRNIGPSIEKMAEAEQLIAHKNAVSIRLKDII